MCATQHNKPDSFASCRTESNVVKSLFLLSQTQLADTLKALDRVPLGYFASLRSSLGAGLNLCPERYLARATPIGLGSL